MSDDFVNLINICFIQFTSALVQINLGDFEGKCGKTSSETLDDSEGEGSLVLTINVGVLHTQNVLEVISILDN